MLAGKVVLHQESQFLHHSELVDAHLEDDGRKPEICESNRERERDEGAGKEMDGGAAQSSAQNKGDRGQDNFPSATLIGVGSSPKIPHLNLAMGDLAYG